jgi:hypothetical protein
MRRRVKKADTEHVEYYELRAPVILRGTREAEIWAKWDNHEELALTWYCSETDFRRIAVQYLLAWVWQDLIKGKLFNGRTYT